MILVGVKLLYSDPYLTLILYHSVLVTLSSVSLIFPCKSSFLMPISSLCRRQLAISFA